jgi:hypothetical protein
MDVSLISAAPESSYVLVDMCIHDPHEGWLSTHALLGLSLESRWAGACLGDMHAGMARSSCTVDVWLSDILSDLSHPGWLCKRTPACTM